MRLRSIHLPMLLLPMLLLMLLAPPLAHAVTVELRAPLSTVVEVGVPADTGCGAAIVTAELTVPSDAPSDLGVGAFIVDGHGRWRQSLRPGRLSPGSQRVRVRIDGDGSSGAVILGRSDRQPRAGIFFWSGAASRALIEVNETGLQCLPMGDDGTERLLDLRIDGIDADRSRARGRSDAAWEVSAKPARAGQEFTMALNVTDEQGVAIEIPARRQPDGRWRTIFHPLRGGAWSIELLARWTNAGAVMRQLLPPLEVSGPRGDPFPDARALTLASPLDTSLALELGQTRANPATPAGEDFAGVDLKVAVPDDAPSDLCVGLSLLAADGSALQGPRPVPLEFGVNQVHLVVVACAPASARVVFWSASDSRAVLKLSSPRELRSPRRAGTRRALFDARVEVDAGSAISPAVGACVILSARPVPEATAGALTATASTRGSPPTVLRGRVTDDPKRRAVSFHPFQTGPCELLARMTWSDGATLKSGLPPLNVVGGTEADHAQAVQVGGPMPTLLPIHGVEGPLVVTATVIVPDDAPADLGAGVYACDRHGRWYQHLVPGVLDPGIHRLRIDLGAGGSLVGVSHQGRWSAAEAAKTSKTGLMLWSADPHRARVLVSGLAAVAPPAARGQRLALYDVRVDEGARGVAAGERWALSLSPSEMPENPYDAKQFLLELVVGTPDGRELRIPGYYYQPMRSSDRGDHEELAPSSAGRFAVRYRPSLPGSHRLRLEASSPGGGKVVCELDPLTVTGRPWDGFVRVDTADPRFFSVGGGAQSEPFWPLGPNLRSVWDLRSKDRMRTRVTPDRGTLAYHAYIERFAAAGANAIEVWLAPWNLGLEWRADWPTFHGQGRYNEDNAWRLERVLDDAWAHGLRVNLVINNHGQGSDSCDAEWPNSPYNRANGGRLNAAAQVFFDPWALDGQERMRRYLVARYADHPAIMAWKLWSEMDLTAGQQTGRLPEWHARAIERWRALDVYKHPITSHWCGDYQHADPAIIAMPNFSFACIDAYHGYQPDGHCGLLADLLRDSAQDPQRGLARYRKPLLVTEFGGDWSGTPNDETMLTEHLTGPWAALMSGHGGAPMLWWFEWVDQGARWQPYTAMSRFLAHEDLRAGHPANASVPGEALSWWIGSWQEKDGTVLGYVLERRWGTGGHRAGATQRVSLSIARPKADGQARIEWWDPDSGRVLATQTVPAGSGSVGLDSPAFSGHLAFKLMPAGRGK